MSKAGGQYSISLCLGRASLTAAGSYVPACSSLTGVRTLAVAMLCRFPEAAVRHVPLGPSGRPVPTPRPTQRSTRPVCVATVALVGLTLQPVPGISAARQGELLRTVFEVLMEHPEGLPGGQVLREMAQRCPLTDYEQGRYKTGSEPRGFTATRWYTVNCVKAGWMAKSRGTWILTDAGRHAFEQYRDPAQFERESSRRYRAWREANPTGDQAPTGPLDAVSPSTDQEPDAESPTALAYSTLEEATEQAWTQVQEYLLGMDPYDFQNLVAALLKSMNYYVHYVSPPGPDQGLDILAFTDPLGVQGARVKVQVKRRQDKANADSLRAFMSILGPNDVGIYMCAGGFTADAMREARNQESRRIMLLDLEKFFELWIENANLLPEQDQALLPLKPVYFLAK